MTRGRGAAADHRAGAGAARRGLYRDLEVVEEEARAAAVGGERRVQDAARPRGDDPALPVARAEHLLHHLLRRLVEARRGAHREREHLRRAKPQNDRSVRPASGPVSVATSTRSGAAPSGRAPASAASLGTTCRSTCTTSCSGPKSVGGASPGITMSTSRPRRRARWDRGRGVDHQADVIRGRAGACAVRAPDEHSGDREARQPSVANDHPATVAREVDAAQALRSGTQNPPRPRAGLIRATSETRAVAAAHGTSSPPSVAVWALRGAGAPC